MVAGLLGTTVFQVCFIAGLSRTSASHSALIASAGPPILGALALWLWRGERPARGRRGSASPGPLLVGDPNAEGATVLGDLISLLAALAWVVVTIVPVSLVKRYGPIRIATWLTLCSGVVVLPFSVGPLIETARDVPRCRPGARSSTPPS